MRANYPSKLPGSLVSAVFAFVVVAGSLGQAFAVVDSKPYFVTKGSDVFTGGWFASGGCPGSATYQNPQNSFPPISSSANKSYFGGIMGFADASGSRSGASSNLAAFSLGNLEADQTPVNLYGFYTGPPNVAPATNGTRSLSFANNGFGINPISNWGGFFEGAFSHSNCIPDYGTKQNLPPNAPTAWAGSFNPGGQFTYSGGTLNLTNGSSQQINASTNLAIFVTGDVYIDRNITYGGHLASTSPKFVLVVQGNIYIDPGVTQLDGWYIAQPKAGGTASTNDGKIWTCHDGSNTQPTDTYVRTQCIDDPLTVNGALTAKEVDLARVTSPGATTIPALSAETVNFIPEMVIGGPFFNPPTTITAPIQSLISLPPVF